MKNKLILENCEYYFHPKFKGYAASLDGYVVHAVNQEVTPGVMAVADPEILVGGDFPQKPQKFGCLHQN